MNLPLGEHQAGVLYDILNRYSCQIDDELEKVKHGTHSFHLLEARKLETDDLIKEFEDMIHRRNVA